jgi:hypothetical protein
MKVYNLATLFGSTAESIFLLQTKLNCFSHLFSANDGTLHTNYLNNLLLAFAATTAFSRLNISQDQKYG